LAVWNVVSESAAERTGLSADAAEADLADEAKVTAWVSQLVNVLNENEVHGSTWNSFVRKDAELNLFEPVIRVRTHG
jgi:DNA gyrase subunit B